MWQILISLTFDDLLNWIAIIGFVFIFIQIHLNNRDVRLTRSIELIGRYFSDYHYLQTLFKRLETEEKQQGGILSRLVDFSAEEIDMLQQNYVSYYQYQLYLKMGIIKETNSPIMERKN